MESNWQTTYLPGIDTPIEGNMSSHSDAASTAVSPASMSTFPNSSPLLPSSSFLSTSLPQSLAPPLRPNAHPPFPAIPAPRKKRARRQSERSGNSQALEVKRERNRIAASKCRVQAMRKQRKLQDDALVLQQQNVDLVTTVNNLREELLLWKVATHSWECATNCGRNCGFGRKMEEWKEISGPFQGHSPTDKDQSITDDSMVDNEMTRLEGLLSSNEGPTH